MRFEGARALPAVRDEGVYPCEWIGSDLDQEAAHLAGRLDCVGAHLSAAKLVFEDRRCQLYIEGDAARQVSGVDEGLGHRAKFEYSGGAVIRASHPVPAEGVTHRPENCTSSKIIVGVISEE